MDKSSRVFVAGSRGLAGGAVTRALRQRGYGNLLLPSHGEVDLEDAAQTESFFERTKPEYVFLAAAKVGGILANNNFPVEFLLRNLSIEINVVRAAHRAGVRRLIFLGSSCIYPRDCLQPIREEYLLTGLLESTNRPYALAKIAGIELCWSYNRQFGTRYLAAMPTNLYGPGDNYDLQNSHVLPALIRKMHEAKKAAAPSVPIWGTGTPRREFLYSDDLADALLFLANLPDPAFDALVHPSQCPLINVGTGEDLQIGELASMVARQVGFAGTLEYDRSKPDGTPRKLMDVSKLKALGWQATTPLERGIGLAYQDFCRQPQPASGR
ncbi:MAG TPA: GDP-L-fucose synthase [Nevskia sp.]|nr:GDP-L-fucose synthase [Nevskia sp.]